MSVFVMPLTNVPQTFDIALAGVNYNMTVKWNDAPESGWVFDLVDSVTNLPVVANIPLITGRNCLDGLDYLGIGGEMIVETDGHPEAVPTLQNLGVESFLYFVTPDEGA